MEEAGAKFKILRRARVFGLTTIHFRGTWFSHGRVCCWWLSGEVLIYTCRLSNEKIDT